MIQYAMTSQTWREYIATTWLMIRSATYVSTVIVHVLCHLCVYIRRPVVSFICGIEVEETMLRRVAVVMESIACIIAQRGHKLECVEIVHPLSLLTASSSEEGRGKGEGGGGGGGRRGGGGGRGGEGGGRGGEGGGRGGAGGGRGGFAW
eukprot:6920070-Pyramimonas_sp.AAC.1